MPRAMNIHNHLPLHCFPSAPLQFRGSPRHNSTSCLSQWRAQRSHFLEEGFLTADHACMRCSRRVSQLLCASTKSLCCSLPAHTHSKYCVSSREQHGEAGWRTTAPGPGEQAAHTAQLLPSDVVTFLSTCCMLGCSAEEPQCWGLGPRMAAHSLQQCHCPGG